MLHVGCDAVAPKAQASQECWGVRACVCELDMAGGQSPLLACSDGSA